MRMVFPLAAQASMARINEQVVGRKQQILPVLLFQNQFRFAVRFAGYLFEVTDTVANLRHVGIGEIRLKAQCLIS